MKAIYETVTSNPDLFFYFNNGITILCESVEKTIKGGGDRESGTFKCRGAQVVNGAQTIGTLLKAVERNRIQVEKAKVLVRLISVGAENEELASQLTRATNRQNRIEKKDFVALDPNQERIRRELYLENIQYIYKSGEKPDMSRYVTLEEATAALACALGNLLYAIHAKKEIGKLWEAIDSPPYAELFPQDLSSQRLLRIVEICRKIDDVLAKYKQAKGDARNLAVHGNKIVQHIVFRICPRNIIENMNVSYDEWISHIVAQAAVSEDYS